MTTGKIKVPKLPFYEYPNAQIAILVTAIFISLCMEVDGTNVLEQDKTLDKKPQRTKQMLKILIKSWQFLKTAGIQANADKLRIILWTPCAFINN